MENIVFKSSLVSSYILIEIPEGFGFLTKYRSFHIRGADMDIATTDTAVAVKLLSEVIYILPEYTGHATVTDLFNHLKSLK